MILKSTTALFLAAVGLNWAWIGQNPSLLKTQLGAENQELTLHSQKKVKVNILSAQDTIQSLQLSGENFLKPDELGEILDFLQPNADWQEFNRKSPLDSALISTTQKSAHVLHRWFVWNSQQSGEYVELSQEGSKWKIQVENRQLKQKAPLSFNVNTQAKNQKELQLSSQCYNKNKDCSFQHKEIPELSGLLKKNGSLILNYSIDAEESILPEDLKKITQDPAQVKEFAKLMLDLFKYEYQVATKVFFAQTDFIEYQPYDWYRIQNEHFMSLSEIEKRLIEGKAQEWPFFKWSTNKHHLTLYSDFKGHYRLEVNPK